MKQLKDAFTMSMPEVDQALASMIFIVSDIKRLPEARKNDAMGPTSMATPTSSGTLTAENLQQQQQQLNKMNSRGTGRPSDVPSAPISSQPPFQFGASSPQGLPSYVGNSAVNVENLHIPARKKPKHNKGTGSGQAEQAASPQLVKGVPPRAQEPDVLPAKILHACPDKECERHAHGFETKPELQRHTEEDHIKPLSDPLKYASENLAAMLGLEQSVPPKPVSPVDEAKTAAQQPVTATSKTPTSATEKPSEGLSVGPLKANTPAESTKHRTGSESKGDAQDSSVAFDPWASTTIDPNELVQSFKQFETGASGAISDMNVYRSLTPNDTPESSKDGLSEPNSDLSDGVGLDINLDLFDDQWMPFGPTYADALVDVNLMKNMDTTLTMEDKLDNPIAWDDLLESEAFDKPFVMDTTLFSLDVI